MSKKVISILLSAAMLVAMFCVGFGAVSAAAEGEEKATSTYYFLAPDNYFKAEAGAVNADVGFYYWDDGGNGAWPGQPATPAPEVHPNAFKVTIPNKDYIAAIVFNAYVDAGEPADPELAKVAHQTKDIYVDVKDCNNMIYVLMQDEAHMSINPVSQAVTSSGDWFTLDSFKDSANYASYNFDVAETDTDVAVDTDKTTDTDTPATGKKFHKDDIVTVTYKIGNLEKAAAVNSELYYNSAVLAVNTAYGDKENDEEGFHVEYEKGSVEVNTASAEGKVDIGATLGSKGVNDFKGEPAAVCTVQFIATADFNEDELGISVKTTSLTNVVDGATNTIVTGDGDEDKAEAYIFIDTDVLCNHTPADTDTPAATDTDKPVVTDTDKPVVTDTDKPVVTTDTEKKTSDSDKKESRDPSSESKKDSSSSSKTSSTSTTTGSTATVQTAGTFAVISLVVILMAAAGVVIHTRKKTEE